jgi:hypothetical protein
VEPCSRHRYQISKCAAVTTYQFCEVWHEPEHYVYTLREARGFLCCLGCQAPSQACCHIASHELLACHMAGLRACCRRQQTPLPHRQNQQGVVCQEGCHRSKQADHICNTTSTLVCGRSSESTYGLYVPVQIAPADELPPQGQDLWHFCGETKGNACSACAGGMAFTRQRADAMQQSLSGHAGFLQDSYCSIKTAHSVHTLRAGMRGMRAHSLLPSPL